MRFILFFSNSCFPGHSCHMLLGLSRAISTASQSLVCGARSLWEKMMMLMMMMMRGVDDPKRSYALSSRSIHYLARTRLHLAPAPSLEKLYSFWVLELDGRYAKRIDNFSICGAGVLGPLCWERRLRPATCALWSYADKGCALNVLVWMELKRAKCARWLWLVK